MKEILCPECGSDLISAKYSIEMFINEMAIEIEKNRSYRYFESTDHYLDGDFSDALICCDCSHGWVDEDWQVQNHV